MTTFWQWLKRAPAGWYLVCGLGGIWTAASALYRPRPLVAIGIAVAALAGFNLRSALQKAGE